MNKVVVSLILLFSITANAQTQRDWALGLSLAPSINSGNAIGIDAIRDYNNKWKLGLKTFYWFYKNEITTPIKISLEQSSAIGSTISTRFILFDMNIFKPYMLVSLGVAYQDWQRSHTYTSPVTFPWPMEMYKHWYMVYSFRFGSEVILAQSTWSIDLNAGYLGLMGLDAGDKGFYRFILSVGMLKRFAIK